MHVVGEVEAALLGEVERLDVEALELGHRPRRVPAAEARAAAVPGARGPGAISSSRAATAASRSSSLGYCSSSEASFSGWTRSAIARPLAVHEVVAQVEVGGDRGLVVVLEAVVVAAAAGTTVAVTPEKSIPHEPCSANASGETSPWRLGIT